METTTAVQQNLSVALRRLAKTPGFSGLAVSTLALGIGAHIAIFSLINVLFLRPLPLPEADRLVGVYESREGNGYYPLSFADYVDHRDAATVFLGLAAHYPTAPLNLEAGDDSYEINGSVVSANYFSLLGVKPARGRFFLEEEDATPGANPVAVVSHRLWQSRLEGRADAVGSVLKLNDTAFTVVGVAPKDFEGVMLGIPSEVWIPTMMSRVGYRWCDTFGRDCNWITMIGRLGPGHTLAEARVEMEVLGRRVREAHPGSADRVRGLSVAPLKGVHPSAREEMMRLAGLLLSAVTLVVIVAGANLSGLLVARGLTRRKEIAIRLAVGARRRHVVVQFVTEALVLSLLGGALGLLIATWLGRVVALFYPSDVPLDLSADPSVIGYAAALSLFCGLAIGVVPGLQAARPNLVPALKGEVTMSSERRPTVLGLLVVAQIALAFVLLTSTGLLLRSLDSAARIGRVDPSSVAAARLRPRLVGYGPEKAQAFSREVVQRLAAMPGVQSVSLGAGLPPWLSGDPVPVRRPGDVPGDVGHGPAAWVNQVAPRFFETFGISLLRGRDFDERDVPESAPVAVVNQTLAASMWPQRDAVGEILVIADEPHEVIGVVQDSAYIDVTQTSAPQAYTAYWQDPTSVDARIGVRTTGDAESFLATMRREIRSVDANVPFTDTETMRGRLRRFLAPVHLAGRVIAVAGGLAIFLSAVGLYGVLALAVAQRTRDIGIRMALGAGRLQVVATVVRHVMILSGIAFGFGFLASLFVNRSLAHYLYDISPRDPLTFAAAAVVLALIAAVASWWPARRATRVNPLTALRQ
jgi:predicted permease